MEYFYLIIINTLILIIVLIIVLVRQKNQERKIEQTVEKNLSSFQDTIIESFERAQKSVEDSKTALSQNSIQTLQSLNKMQEKVSRLTHQQAESIKLADSLKDLLARPKLRGNFGEKILEEILETELPHSMWQRQAEITKNSKERVDAIIKYRGIIIPIDAKFPRTDLKLYIEAETDKEKQDRWKEFTKTIKKQIDSIALKYVKPEQGTSDFGLIFIPTDAIYYETISEKPFTGRNFDLYEYAWSKKVIPVSPSTLFIFIHVLLLGLTNVELIKNAHNIGKELGELNKNFDKFYNKIEEAGKALIKAEEAYRIASNHIERFRKKLKSAATT